MKKIDKLKAYKSILLDLKRILIIQNLDKDVESKIPSYRISNQKVKKLTLFKKYKQ